MKRIAFVVCLLVAATLHAQERRKITIFIAPQTRDGFVDTDSGINDSITDIKNELKGSRDFDVVMTAERAEIRLTVLSRRIAGNGGAIGISSGSATYGGGAIAGVKQPSYTSPGVTSYIPIEGRVIDTVMRVGEYEKVTSSDDNNAGSWRLAARKVVKDLTAWLEANRAAMKP